MRTSRAVLLTSTALALAFALIFAACAPTVFAQSASSAPATSASPIMQLVPRKAATPITGAPFSSVAERRQTQTLANGTHIDLLETVTRMYRDSQGRTRMEVLMGRPDASGENRLLSATISDPTSGKSYFLDPRIHEARMTQYFSSGTAMLAPSISAVTSSSAPYPSPKTIGAPSGRYGNPDATTTQLGDDTLVGVPVRGSRTTTIFPVGLVGNDQPLTVTREEWESKDLHILMLSKADDPRSGEITMRVTQLERTEPDASLFQVPADYTIVEK